MRVAPRLKYIFIHVTYFFSGVRAGDLAASELSDENNSSITSLVKSFAS